MSDAELARLILNAVAYVALLYLAVRFVVERIVGRR